MRSAVVALVGFISLSLSGCFLVGYDGIDVQPDSFDSGKLPDIEPSDASDGDDDDDDTGEDDDDDDDDDMDASAHDAAPQDAALDADVDVDAARDAGDASLTDGGDDLDASLDASLDAGDDGGIADAGRDGGHPVIDAGPPRDAGPTPDPMPHCNSSEQCKLQCGDVPACTPTCDSNTSCDIDCDGADYCKPTCNKSLSNICEVDCTQTNQCDATCKGGGDCKVDCRQNGTCKKTRCEGAVLAIPPQLTQCMIVCDANDPDCGFEYCWGDAYGSLTISGIGVVVKQQTCTGNSGTKVVLCGGTYGFSDVNPYLPCQAK